MLVRYSGVLVERVIWFCLIGRAFTCPVGENLQPKASSTRLRLRSLLFNKSMLAAGVLLRFYQGSVLSYLHCLAPPRSLTPY